MACTPGSIAAEGVLTASRTGSRHAGVGAPSFVSCIRNASVLFCCRPVGLGVPEVWGNVRVRA